MLVIARPRGGLLREALRLLPDLLRLLPRLAAARRAGYGQGSRCCWPTSPSPSTWCPPSSRCWGTPTMPSSWPLGRAPDGRGGDPPPVARHRRRFAALCRLTGLIPPDTSGPAEQPQSAQG